MTTYDDCFGGFIMAKHTPMIKQYLKIKAEHKDSFLFFRLGDFYELFFDDAIKAAQELEITLTKRDSGQKEEIPMCGVPYHSASNYIKILIDKGYKVAICEQTEDPKKAKGIVKREVIQVITPGTVMESTMLEEHDNNYIASLSHFPDGTFVLAYNDLSTGENRIALLNNGWEQVIHELYNQPIKEVVIATALPKKYQEQLKDRLHVTISYEDKVNFNAEYRFLCENINNDERLMKGFSRLLNYIQHTQKRSLNHLQQAKIIELNQYLSLDMYSKRNLELTESILRKGKHGSLLWILDKTVTAMGSRQLKKWIERPLLHQTSIENRLDIVESFLKGFMQREQLRQSLKSVYDLERLAGRVAFGNVNARDLIQLKNSLQQIPNIKQILTQFEEEKTKQLAEQLQVPNHLIDLLEKSIKDDPPVSIKEGSLIKDGYHKTLDTYRDASHNGKKWIAELEKKEKEETNIRSLKIGYNRVFGYYIEVTKANLHLLPEGRYERKQTLTNAERFVTPELKEKEQLILEAEEKSIDLEYELFLGIREKIKEHIPQLQVLAEIISTIDVLQSFALVSEINHYTRPVFHQQELSIKDGRHPVVEQVIKGGSYVPNDINLDEDTDILLITGPNMSGKSTYMRQLALIIIMGQIGCFVPAEKAHLKIFDKIFTRIGAADDLVSGQSTFMVEMLEANHALKNATENSLILLDEIGRGTSTYDGIALAQAIVEYIHDFVYAKTLFSTHYHELTALETSLPRLKNIHVRAEEYEGNVVFLHQVKEGAADKSYGIHVAKLANLPGNLIERATTILNKFEQAGTNETETMKSESNQLSLFEEQKEKNKPMKKSTQQPDLAHELSQINLLEMTPIDALNELYRLQKLIK